MAGKREVSILQEEDQESADVKKIVTKLYFLSNKTVNVEGVIEEFSELWSPEEKTFLLHLPDPTLKNSALYSKIIARDDSALNIKLMNVLRRTSNDFVADEISDLSQDAGSGPKLLRVPSSLNVTEEDDNDNLHFDRNSMSPRSSLGESFAAVTLELSEEPPKEESPPEVKSITYEFTGSTGSATSQNQLSLMFKLPLQKITHPQELFISESYFQRITTLQLSDFIINQSHLAQALAPCVGMEVLEIRNVFYELQSLKSNAISRVWLPKLKKFVFHSKNLAGSLFTTEGYSWEQIAFFESNAKGQPSNLRTIWQSHSIDVSIKTLSMQVEVNHEFQTVSFTLFRRHLNTLPIIPDYFLDSFLRNCRQIQFLQIRLPEVCSKLDFDSLPQELSEMNLAGFVIMGEFKVVKTLKTLYLSNCVLPNIFLAEMAAILPQARSIQIVNCQQESSSNSPINVKIVALAQ